jgi:hypothetical protein
MQAVTGTVPLAIRKGGDAARRRLGAGFCGQIVDSGR